jgi:hypothetical protein
MRFERFAASSARWDFSPKSLKDHGVVGKDILMECWAYEFSRENKELVKKIRAWRDGLGTSLSFEQLLRASAGSPLLRIDHNEKLEIEAHFVTIRFPAIYVFSPEWPEKSFLEIPSEERNQRVALANKKLPGKVRWSYSWYTYSKIWGWVSKSLMPGKIWEFRFFNYSEESLPGNPSIDEVVVKVLEELGVNNSLEALKKLADRQVRRRMRSR